MTISELRKSPLSDEIVVALYKATEAHAELVTLQKLHPERIKRNQTHQYGDLLSIALWLFHQFVPA